MIEIKDGTENLLAVSLKDLLGEIGAEGAKLNWCLLYLWAVGDRGGYESLGDLNARVDASPHGIYLSWNEVNCVASKFEQEIDMLLLGFEGEASFLRQSERKSRYGKCQFVLELVDGYAWKVYSKDEGVIERLISRFNEVQIIEFE